MGKSKAIKGKQKVQAHECGKVMRQHVYIEQSTHVH